MVGFEAESEMTMTVKVKKHTLGVEEKLLGGLRHRSTKQPHGECDVGACVARAVEEGAHEALIFLNQRGVDGSDVLLRHGLDHV